MSVKFSATATLIAQEIEKNIKVLENNGVACDRCGGQGVCNDNPIWINTKLKDRAKVTHVGKVCFKCNGAGTLTLAKKKRASVLKCGYAYYKSITFGGVVDFGRMVHQYRKWENNIWGSVMQPLYHHINRVVVAQALAGKFEFKDDQLVFDPRCYSYYPYAMQFLDLFPTARQAQINAHSKQVMLQNASRGRW